MTNEIEQSESRELAQTPTNPMQLLQLAMSGDVDVAKLERLMELQERWEQKQAREAFNAAIAEFQGSVPEIEKKRGVKMTRGDGPADYYYASLDDIMRTIKPYLVSCGISVSFSAEVLDTGNLHVECSVRCGSHAESSHMTLPIPAEMRVNATQKMGAAMSYAKRYALCAALNLVIADEDNDAAVLSDFIDDAQKRELKRLIDESGADVARFLAKFEVDELAEMTVSQYREAVPLLQAKLSMKGKQ